MNCKKIAFSILFSVLSLSLFSVPITLSDQGVFSAGGVTVQADGVFDPVRGQYATEGQMLYADHASVLYQIPEDDNGHSMVFLHGYGQSRTGWMVLQMGVTDGMIIFSPMAIVHILLISREGGTRDRLR